MFSFSTSSGKYLKAYVVKFELPFKKEHNLVKLLKICRHHDESFKSLWTHCRYLNAFYLETRYADTKFAVTSKENTQTAFESVGQIQKVIRFYPYKINYLLTDNGFEFSYKALPKNKKTKKVHPFDKICQENKIQHRTIKFKHPWTNGMVENFNKRVKKQVLTKYLFQSIFDLNGKLLDFVDDYNQHKRLKSLNYKTPAQYLKETKGITLQRIVN